MIYIGKSIHIRKRIDQHLRNTKTKKGIQLQQEIARIEYELTGSELIALLRESDLIKLHKPIYNRSLTRSSFPYGLFYYQDDHGYFRLFIDRISKINLTPLTSFISKKEGTVYLERMVEEYNLCPKLCDLYKTTSACFNYTVKNCSGACVQEESSGSYNKRSSEFINKLKLDDVTFFVVDKGRSNKEKSLILIKNGILAGIGYAPYYFRSQPITSWERYLDIIRNDRDARTILNLFLRKNKSHEVINLID